MDTYVIEPTHSWYTTKLTLNPSFIKKQNIRKEILNHWCMMSNYKLYNYKHITSTDFVMVDNAQFIISYPLKKYAETCEQQFIELVNSIQLQYHRQNIFYNNQPAYKIIIADKNVNLKVVLNSSTCTDDYRYNEGIQYY